MKSQYSENIPQEVNLEFIKGLAWELQRINRPADQVVLDEFDFTQFLKISKRKAAYLREKRAITYIKVDGKLYYRLSDVLDFLKAHEVQSIESKISVKL